MVMDVVERINELAAEEKCPHCERDFHQGALTQKVAAMFERGTLDSQYFAREDTSPIVCDGSTFIGPLRPEPLPLGTTYASVGWLSSAVIATYTLYNGAMQKLWQGIEWPTLTIPTYSYSYALGVDETLPWIFPQWKFDDSAELEPACADPVPEVDVEFGPQNWSIVIEDVHAEPALVGAVAKRWHAFQRDDTPKPAPKKMNLKPIAEKFNQQFNYFNKEKKCSR